MQLLILAFIAICLCCVAVDAQEQEQESVWEKIFACNFSTNDRFVMPLAQSQQLANRARRVKICTAGDPDDCVVSNPNTFPIQNLRNGYFAFSHDKQNNNAPCTFNCVMNTWTGPEDRLLQLIADCFREDGIMAPHNGYWGCGNASSLHVLTAPYARGRLCGWTTNSRNDNIDFFIDSNTLSPTISPTTSPTPYLLSAEHQASFDEMRSTLIETVLEVSTLRSTLETEIETEHSTMVSNMMSMSNEMTRMADAHASLTVAAVQNATELQAYTSRLRAAISTAVSATTTGQPLCVGGNCVPSIQSDGFNVAVNAPGGRVSVSGANCVADDLCAASKFSSDLYDALSGV